MFTGGCFTWDQVSCINDLRLYAVCVLLFTQYEYLYSYTPGAPPSRLLLRPSWWVRSNDCKRQGIVRIVYGAQSFLLETDSVDGGNIDMFGSSTATEPIRRES